MRNVRQKIKEPREARVNVKIFFLRSDNFIFREILGKKEELTEEKQIIIPYAFPEFTNPIYSVLWSA